MAKDSRKLSRTAKAQILFNEGARPIATTDGWVVLGRGAKDLYKVREFAERHIRLDCPDYAYRGHGGISARAIWWRTLQAHRTGATVPRV